MSLDRRPLYAAFARLLEYPGPTVPEALAAARAALGGHEEAHRRLDAFTAAIRDAGLARLQEHYTAAFDLDPLACPYVGHQLLGESPQRGFFLSRLIDVYEAVGFARGTDLPDHLVEVLRFLAHVGDRGGEGEVVLRDGLAPALRKMAAALEKIDQPYGDVVGALLAVVEDAVPAPAVNEQHRSHRMEALR